MKDVLEDTLIPDDDDDDVDDADDDTFCMVVFAWRESAVSSAISDVGPGGGGAVGSPPNTKRRIPCSQF